MAGVASSSSWKKGKAAEGYSRLSPSDADDDIGEEAVTSRIYVSGREMSLSRPAYRLTIMLVPVVEEGEREAALGGEMGGWLRRVDERERRTKLGLHVICDARGLTAANLAWTCGLRYT